MGAIGLHFRLLLMLSGIPPSTEPCDDANYGKHEHEPNAILVVSGPGVTQHVGNRKEYAVLTPEQR